MATLERLGTTTPERLPRSPGAWESAFASLWANKIAMIALAGMLIITLISFAAPIVSEVRGIDRDAVDLLNTYKRPTSTHWFGTDENGRDYFIRTLYAGQVSIQMGVSVAVVVMLIGVPLGMMAGFYRGLYDDLFTGAVQVLMTTPTIFALILLFTILPPTPLLVAVCIGALSWTGEALQTRGLTMSIKNADYVLAARAMGATDKRIMFRHILPAILPIMLIFAGSGIIAGVLVESSLSFLGLGVRPPTPSWGNMLTNSLQYVYKAPHLIFFPVAAIGIFTLCVYMLADGLRDAFDPQTRN